MNKFYWVLVFIITTNSVAAQLLEQKDSYDRCDSLRGSLNQYRTCFDVHYYDLLVDIQPDEKHIDGKNEIHFKVTSATNRIQLDLFDVYEIITVTRTDVDKPQQLNFERECQAFFIDFPKQLNRGENVILEITYKGNPPIAKRAPWDGGFVFEKDLEDNHWIGVACEGFGASSWWPNKDHLSDEPDSMMVRCIVPKDLTAVCNGNLVGQSNVGTDKKQFDWKVTYPINNYNVSVNIANYVHFKDVYTNEDGEELALDYYVLPYNLQKAKKQFEQVKPMMKCFEEYLGKYPFYNDGFAMVETPYLGMEHQSAIAYGNNYKTGYAGRDYSGIGLDFDYIIIHEAGHEWWGNSVSMKDVSDMWIHEGFCTYSEALYVECLHGYETAMDYVNAKKKNIRNEKPVLGKPGVNEEGAGDMYNKGMLFLNTVRHLLDDDELWFSIVKGITEDFKYKTTDTKEIVNYINEKAGEDLTKIFDQYLAYPAIPQFEYKVKRNGKIKYKWNANVPNFNMPVKLNVSENKTHWLKPTTTWQKTKLPNFKFNEFSVDERHFYINTVGN